MRRIFLDIGAYTGDTARVVLDKKYGFDEIHCFEPVKTNYELIKRKFVDKKVIIHEFGLLDKNCEQPIYRPGFIGGSIFREKKNVNDSFEMCKFVKASDWFKTNLSKDDYNIVKINVEGAEIDILNDLLDTGEYDKVKHILISFDIIKVKGKEHLKEKLLSKFDKNVIYNYLITGQLKYILRRLHSRKSSHDEIIKMWLKIIE